MNYYIDKVIDVMKAGLGSKIKYYYFGDPLVMPKSMLEQGVMIVAPSKNDIQVADTQRDLDQMQITITVIKDLRQDFDKQPQKAVVARWLTDILEGRNNAGLLQADTVRSIIRSNLSTIGTVSNISIEYGVAERDETLVGAGKVTFNLTDFTNR